MCLKTFWFEETFSQKKNNKDNELGVQQFQNSFKHKRKQVHYRGNNEKVHFKRKQSALYSVSKFYNVTIWDMYLYKQLPI